jgi:hypothetical protein
MCLLVLAKEASEGSSVLWRSPQRAFAALRAIEERLFGDKLAALAFPPMEATGFPSSFP